MTYALIAERWPEEAVRQAELDRALAVNLGNDFIDSVLLLCQPGSTVPSHPKIATVQLTDRLTFNETLSTINKHLSGRVCLFANADIAFDSSLGRLQEYDWNTHVACLTRWFEYDGAWHPFYVKGSFDVWVFKAPVKEDGEGDFTMGTAGCDGRTTFELRLRTGYKLVNPAWDVIARHFHWSDKRNYLAVHIPGNYALVLPHRIGVEPKAYAYAYRCDGNFPDFVHGSCAPDCMGERDALKIRIPVEPASGKGNHLLIWDRTQ